MVTVDAGWTFPPFSATRRWLHLRSWFASTTNRMWLPGLMTLLELKRLNVPLDRDVIFLAESGEEGATQSDRLHDGTAFLRIDAEFCLAEGGTVRKLNGRVQFASVGTEKVPRTIELIAKGPSAHGSVPIATNAVGHLARAVSAVRCVKPPRDSPERDDAGLLRAHDWRLVAQDACAVPRSSGSDDRARETLPRISSTCRRMRRRCTHGFTDDAGRGCATIIPSEAHCPLDVRLLPDDGRDALVETLRKVINDPIVDVTARAATTYHAPPGVSGIETDAFRMIQTAAAQNYDTVTIPPDGHRCRRTMRRCARKACECCGVGPAVDAGRRAERLSVHTATWAHSREANSTGSVRFSWDGRGVCAGRGNRSRRTVR